VPNQAYGGSYYFSGSTIVTGGYYGIYDVRVYYDGAPRVRPIAQVTTRVQRGGLIMALARASDTWRAYDDFGYADPNACGPNKRARWTYGQLVNANLVALPVYGWVLERIEQRGDGSFSCG
jgi:hypothetical protein